MANKIIYMVVGIGLNLNPEVAAEKGEFCQTWPDCERGFPGLDPRNESDYDDTGFIPIVVDCDFTAMGGTVFEHEWEALGWLEHAAAGIRFKKYFSNVVIIRSTV
jgi:hypothetical protein